MITKDELLKAVWGYTAVTENSLARSIALLRRQLGDEPRNPRYIETAATVGYRFISSVEVSEEASETTSATDAQQACQAAAPSPLSPSVFSKPPNGAAVLLWRNLALWLSGGAVCLVIGIFTYLKWLQPHPVQPLAAVPLGFTRMGRFPGNLSRWFASLFEWTGEQIFTAFNLYVKTIGNENLLRLTNDPAAHLAPTWSPDGRTIAFSDSPFPGGHKRLQLLSLETLQSTPIEHNDKCIEEVLPAFSPDGKQLAYACSLSSREGEFGLSIVTTNGRAPRIIKESSDG